MGCGFTVDVQTSVKSQISAMEANLSLAEKKIAELIKVNPALVVDSNVSETAELSGASEATIVRFCRHLGYSGFYQMKLQLSYDIGHQQRSLLRESESSSMHKRLMHIDGRIQMLCQKLDLKAVKLCAEAINNCATVHLIGSGQSRILATDIAFRLAGKGIRTICSGDYKIEIANLLSAPQEDILICISKSGETKRVIQAAEIAREKGMTVLAFTSVEKSPLHSIASITLSTGISAEDAPDSHLLLSVLIEAVFTYVRLKLDDVKYFESIVSESRI